MIRHAHLVVLSVGISSAAFAQEATTPEPSPAPTVAPTPAPAVAVAAQPEALHARFRFDVKLASGLLGLTGLVPQAIPGIIYGRWSVGLGLGFLRAAVGTSTSGSPGSGSEISGTLFSFAPTGVFEVLRSSDEKVGLYVLAAIVPSILVTGSGSGPCANNANFVFGYQAALGARYSFHPQFMLGLEAGPTGQIASMSFGCSMPGSTSTSVGVHGLYSSLVGTFTTN